MARRNFFSAMLKTISDIFFGCCMNDGNIGVTEEETPTAAHESQDVYYENLQPAYVGWRIDESAYEKLDATTKIRYDPAVKVVLIGNQNKTGSRGGIHTIATPHTTQRNLLEGLTDAERAALSAT